MFKRLIAWFKGEQEPSSPDETSPVEADESAAPPSGTSLPNRGFSVWTVGEPLKVNPISKTVGKSAPPSGTSLPNRGFSVWTVGELPKVNPISKTVGKSEN